MKKVILMIVLALLLIFSLTACDMIEDIIGGGGVVVTPTQGEWSDRVFTSEYMGFRFALSSLWDAPTAAEWVALMEAGAYVLEGTGLELPEEYPTLYMVARNLLTGANVQITYHRYGRRTPNVDEVIDATSEELTGAGVRVVGNRGSVRLGAHDWTYISTEVTLGDIVSRGRQFYNVYSGYIRIITVTTMTGADEIDEITQMFIGLEGPVPESVAIEFSEALLDAWLWYDDFDFIYFFDVDGMGVRGFSDGEEEFQWRTSGDTLLIETDIGAEGWTFTIQGDILTLDSLQEQGLSFSYFRVGSDLYYEIFDEFFADFDFGFDFDTDELVGTVIDMDLVDIWVWYDNNTYFLAFDDDGFGMRGFYPDLDLFAWGTQDGDHLMISIGRFLENWTFTIDGDTLTIDSRDEPGLTFSYFRMP